jgi:hypothetical protein
MTSYSRPACAAGSWSSPAVAGAYAGAVRAQVAILNTLNTEIAILQGQVEAHFGQHRRR